MTGNFWIGTDAEIERIRVVRAMDPGAAWILIDSIAEATVSRSRVEDALERDPGDFPIALCTYWNYEEPDPGLPASGNMRGF